MRDKIKFILDHYLFVSGSGRSIAGKADAADHLTAFMCYREVRAFIDSYECMSGEDCVKTFADAYDECRLYLSPSYQLDIILKAIEQVKKGE